MKVKLSLVYFEGFVPRVVVAKYEDNTPRTYKVMIKFADGNANAATMTVTIPLNFLRKKNLS
jgi:hypothetical protein